MQSIKAPLHCHIFWSATRVRRFARLLSGNPKRRGTYDENIRLLNKVYSLMIGQESDPRKFMLHVNPVLFLYELGMPSTSIKRFLRDSWPRLMSMAVHSTCAHCKNIAVLLN